MAIEAIGGVSVDTRDRAAANTDGGDVDNNDLWRDFVFANGSFDTVPGSGLRITLTGLQPSTTYPITIWAFDESSNGNRIADWGAPGEPTQSLTFPSDPDPASLADYNITIEVSTDAGGQVVIEGIVAAVSPSTSHNVFVNALAIGKSTGSTVIRITEIELDEATGDITLTWTSSPGRTYAVDLTTDLAGWPADIDDGIPAADEAELTSYSFSAAGVGPRAYFRVREIAN